MIGKFITFEGGEGVGKSTQVRLLAQKLSDSGLKVHVTREPGGDEIGEKIRNILRVATNIDPICNVLLIFAARRDHFVKIIYPLLKQGYTVICDRFYDSSLVYQGILKGVPFEDIMKLKYMSVGDFEPDLTIILNMNVDVSTQRVTTRNLTPDEYDLMDYEKHSLIQTGFRKIAEIFSFRSVLINAEGSEQAVLSRIYKIIEKRLLYDVS